VLRGYQNEFGRGISLRPLRRAEELAQRTVVCRIGKGLDGRPFAAVCGIRLRPGVIRARRDRTAMMAEVGSGRFDVRAGIRAMKMLAKDAMPAWAEQRNAAKKGRKGPNRGSLNQNAHQKTQPPKRMLTRRNWRSDQRQL